MSENNQILSSNAQLVGMPIAGPESFSQQQLAYLKRALGVDETVLYDNGTTTSATLSESMSNFERIRFFFVRGDGMQYVQEIHGGSSGSGIVIYQTVTYTNDWVSLYSYRYTVSNLTISPSNYLKEVAFQTGKTAVTVRNTAAPTIVKVVGIHRIAGGNQ